MQASFEWQIAEQLSLRPPRFSSSKGTCSDTTTSLVCRAGQLLHKFVDSAENQWRLRLRGLRSKTTKLGSTRHAKYLSCICFVTSARHKEQDKQDPNLDSPASSAEISLLCFPKDPCFAEKSLDREANFAERTPWRCGRRDAPSRITWVRRLLKTKLAGWRDARISLLFVSYRWKL